jgi:hypothetical protein
VSEVGAGVADAIAGLLCDDAASADGLDKAERKCQLTLAKILTTFGAKKTRCLAACHRRDAKGKTDGGCSGAVSIDTRTQACTSKAGEAAMAWVVKRCDPHQPFDASGCVVHHLYAANASYTARLRVTDGQAMSDETTDTIVVGP